MSAKAIGLSAAILLAGCSTIQENQAEFAWQALHAVDTAQTLQIANSEGCYWESGSGTHQLIGKHPSQSGVLTWGIGLAFAHLGVTKYLEHHGPKWLSKTWKSVTIGQAAYYVKNNYDQGIGVTGDNNCK